VASIRTRALRDGSLTHSVLFRLDGKQTSETFDTRSGAEAFVKDVERYGPDAARRLLDSRRGTDAHRRRTVSEQIAKHVASLPNVTPGTRRKYAAVGHELERHRLGSMPIDAVHHDDVAAWIRDLAASGLSRSSMDFRKVVLQAAFNRAIRDELIARNPCVKQEVPRTEPPEQTYLTPQEFERVMAHVEPGDRVLLYLMAGTGLRVGEATALQVRDIHLDDAPPTLTVLRTWRDTAGPEKVTGPPKTARGKRTVTLPPQLVAMLREHVSSKGPQDWVFLDHRGEPVARNRLSERWHRAVRAAGIGKSPRIHDLRHTHASWLIAAGVPLTTIQHRLGHASIKVTSDVYGHLMPEAQIQAARAAAAGLGDVYIAERAQIGQH
jgi:integrase